VVIYVSDAGNLQRRLATSHCHGNVESSALRKQIAATVGWRTVATDGPSGNRRLRLDMPDWHAGEAAITQYLGQGAWQIVTCASPDEANDFQWYAIEKLSPVLNVDRRPPDPSKTSRFDALLSELLAAAPVTCGQASQVPESPGVYIFHHAHRPRSDVGMKSV